MLKNNKDHYVPDFEHHKHHNIKNVGGEASYDPLHDYSPEDLCKEKIKSVKKWLEKEGDIKAALLIGSYARGEERIDSDVDFIFVVDDIEHWTKNTSWVKKFGKVLSVSSEQFEEVSALRVYYQDTNELEFGFVNEEWLQKPYVKATQEALDSGMKVLLDSNKYFNE